MSETENGGDVGKSCEEEVCEQIMARRAHGIAKYGVGLEREDLTELQWLQHAQEEAMDLAGYLQRLKRKLTIRTPESEHVEAVLQKTLNWLKATEHRDRTCLQPIGTGGARVPCTCGLWEIREGIKKILSASVQKGNEKP